MLYNFINAIFPFTFICLGVGIVFLLISHFLDDYSYSEKFYKFFSRIGNILYAIGIIFLVSTLPVRLGSLPLIIIAIILLLLIGIEINITLTDTEYKYDVYIIQNIILIVSTIIFSITLYPDYKVNTTVQENMPISEETRILTSFNDIPLASVSGEMRMALTFGKGEVSTSEYVTYWYVDEHGDVLYDKSLAYNSVKKISEDNNYHLTITTYATVTKRTTKHKELKDLQKNKKTVYVFYLPKELVGTIN